MNVLDTKCLGATPNRFGRYILCLKTSVIRVQYTWLLCLLLLLCGYNGQAQPVGEIGGLVGGASYLGDLVEQDEYPYLNTTRPAIGLYAGIPIGYTFQLRGGLQYAHLQGDDENFDLSHFNDRGFSFQTDLFEVSAVLMWEPFARKRYPRAGGYKKIISPYLFAGGALSFFSWNTDYGSPGNEGFSELIRQDERVSKESPQWVLPFGGGLRFDLNYHSSLGLEIGARKTYTDYLDGVSISGNADANDWYLVGGVTFSYRFSKPDYDRDRIMDSDDRCVEEAGLLSLQGCPDADGDGLPDWEDMCPYQVGKRELNGCPDGDYDGVADLIDECPDFRGEISAGGCPDADLDGVRDLDDMCPDCPGEADQFGCPDADRDGIVDSKDRCPNIPGPRKWNGCPYLDSDGDGVPDETDECPDEKGRRHLGGCPDRDNDGIADLADECPGVPGEANNNGCPVVPEKVQEFLTVVTESVQFETASSRLKEISLEKLDELVTILEEYTYFTLSIEGHTDSRGREDANLRLSQARAKSCYDYLLQQGVSADRMDHQGYGESQPIASNDTRAGRSKNRRVAFSLVVMQEE